MKRMALAAMAVAAAALLSGPVAAQDTGSSVASAPPATMQPIPNPPEKAAMSHGSKHGKHRAMRHGKKSSGAKMSKSAGSDNTAAAPTPAPQQ